MKIKVGARDSELSSKQVEEVQRQVQVAFEPILLKTTGDKNRTVSLRGLDKTDFFTKEIDTLLLQGGCRIAIHSAKDLPDPLPKGLVIAALTRGVDSSDALVLRPGETLQEGFVIATSSQRREQLVKPLKEKLRFVDIRGTIRERLEKLYRHEIDGVVIAEAAIIRLNLKYLNRIPLLGETAPLQGRLAVVVREGDEEMLTLFGPLHAT